LGTLPKKNFKNSYLNNVGPISRDTEIKIEDDEDEEDQEGVRGYSCSNSTKQLILPYWSFVFSDVNLRDYVCIQMNLPSGICSPNGVLSDKVEATVSSCKTRLIVLVEWPETLSSSACMEDALSSTWGATGRDASNGSTVGNMIQAFKKEIHKIRTQNKVSKNCLLGSTCTIDLPFQVETDMVVCEPNWERTIGSINLYVVLKKQSKKSEIYEENKMKVRMSNALANGNDCTTHTTLQYHPIDRTAPRARNDFSTYSGHTDYYEYSGNCSFDDINVIKNSIGKKRKRNN
jgi:hypothetical protein